MANEFDEHRSAIYRQLDAARIEVCLSPVGDKQTLIGSIPERHLRPLAPYRDQPEIVRSAYAEAVERTNGHPTGHIVKEAVDQIIADRDEEARTAPLPGQMSFPDVDEIVRANRPPAIASQPTQPHPIGGEAHPARRSGNRGPTVPTVPMMPTHQRLIMVIMIAIARVACPEGGQ